ncbi:MAG TPA: ABC transporter permease [Pseudonocardiaceae bacterium]
MLAGRSLRTAFGDYRLVFFGLLQPVVMLLLFSQVFSRVGTLPGVVQYRGYINYLMPATLINIAVTTAMSSGVGVLAEVYTGFVGRLRAMPISMFAVLVARTLADALRLTVQLAVAVIAAVAFLDFRPSDVVGIVTALGLAVLVGWGLGWVFVAIATWQRKAETMQAISFVVMFPLMFGSSAYMPVAAMPAWLRVLSTINPLTYAIDATRALTAGTSAAAPLAAAIGIVIALAALGAAGAARNFRRAN